MKTFIIILAIINLIYGESMDKQETKSKPTPSTINVPNQDLYLQQQQQFKFQQPYQQIPIKQQYLPLQMLQRPYYVPQPQPHAMIIIAQPAIIPSSLIYGNNPVNAQQLLHYIQNNPQTKYQQLMQATYMQPIVSSPNYILAPQPQLLTTIPSTLAPTTNQLSYTTSPTQATQQQQEQQLHQQQHQQSQQQSHIQPLQLGQLAHLAQLAAQQYMTPIKTVTPIVTGFEHFTPEQQAQIKAQLTNHLGTNFHAVSATNNGQFSAKYPTPEQGFVPSQQIKNDLTSNGVVKDKL